VTTVIDEFRGAYAFLSNFHPSPLTVLDDGFVCATAEHAFQSLKATSAADEHYIASAPSAGEAKRRGRQVKLVGDWEDMRTRAMAEVLRAKFEQHPELGRRLAQTGDATLIEGNTWHDQFWGDCRCPEHQATPGENWLGKLLMELRVHVQTQYGVEGSSG